jgi:hypothetical protein
VITTVLPTLRQVAGRPSVCRISMSEVRSERCSHLGLPWSNQLAPISRRRGANAGTRGGAQSAGCFCQQAASPLASIVSSRSSGRWMGRPRWMAVSQLDLTVSLVLVLILICETVVFQVARVSVGSVRAFISYLEDVCSLPWGDVLTACLGSGRS